MRDFRKCVHCNSTLGPGQVCTCTMQQTKPTTLAAIGAENGGLKADIECERMRLAGCGVAAMSNTEKTVAERIDRTNPNWSASYGDVCAAVDREMEYRAKCEAAEKSNLVLAAQVSDMRHQLTQALGAFEKNWAIDWNGLQRATETPTSQTEAKVAEMVAALEFYGDGGNYNVPSHRIPAAFIDNGRRARQALRGVK